MKTIHRIGASILAVALFVGCAARRPAVSSGVPPDPTSSPTEQAASPAFSRELAVQTFEAAWRIVHETHFDPTFNGVDWLAVRAELQPSAQQVRTQGELRDLIRSMLRGLEQSHFRLVSREEAAADATDATDRARQGEWGFDVRLIDDQMVVSGVAASGPAASGGIAPGWVLRRIDGSSVAGLVADVQEAESRYPDGNRAWFAVRRRLLGSAGSVRRLELLDGDDRIRAVEVVLEPASGGAMQLGNLGVRFANSKGFQVERDGARAGVIRFDRWLIPVMKEIDRAIDRFRDLDGIIVDLRGNRGGEVGTVMGFAGHFFDEVTSLGVNRGRTSTLNVVALPRKVSPSGKRVHPYRGPVAILVDELSGSASEVFAGGLQSLGRARVFGSRTPGAVLGAAADRLPNGDVLVHAIASFETATGERLEGRGVIPDEPVASSRADHLAGRDAVLESAVRWIAERRRSDFNAVHRSKASQLWR